MRETARNWVALLTASRPDTSGREGAYRALRSYFEEQKQAELVPEFMALAENASARQRRILADLAAESLLPGDAWQALLKEHRHDYCRRLARACMRLWSDQLVSGALRQGIERALQDQDEARLQWLMRLTLEVAKKYPTASLREVERLLAKKSEAQRGWRRTNPVLGVQVKAFHTALIEVIAPADTPLTAMAPQTEHGLPLPADARNPATIEALPLPSEDTAPLPGKAGFWKRLFQRFLRKRD